MLRNTRRNEGNKRNVTGKMSRECLEKDSELKRKKKGNRSKTLKKNIEREE